MRRLVSVILFLILSASAFWGILRYAKVQEDIKKQASFKIETVKVYTDWQSNILEEISQDFYAETGFQIEIVRLTAGQMRNNTITLNNDADVFLTSQATLTELKRNKRLLSYSSETTDTALERFKDKDGYWIGLWIDPVVFVVNKDFAAKHPLLNYNWTDIMMSSQIRLTMTDFVAADMSEELLMSMVEHFGAVETFYLLSEGSNHIVQYGKYLSTPSRMAGMGKCDIGISSYNEAIRAQSEKLPIQIVYPTDGTAWYLYGAGISAGSKHPVRGKKLIDWLLTPARYKRIMRNNGYYFIYVNDVKLSPDFNGTSLSYWELEKIYSNEGKKVLLNEWIEKVRFRRGS